MATTFHPFPRLPFEIRSQIWAMAVYPRLVHLRTSPKSGPSPRVGHYFASKIPQAELMHVCRESRQLAPYQKTFFTTLPGDSEARYIWVNFDEDMICLPHKIMSTLYPHAADIQRLRFTVPTGDDFEYWADVFTKFTNNYFKRFTVLREVHLAISENITWWSTTYGSYGPCPPDNVKFLDLHTGLLLTKPQLVLAGEWDDRRGWLVEDMENFDEELQFYNDNCYTFIEDCSEVE
ncbi:hypothetical protein ACQKWADRAFT_265977 [Trichoderma austrokoningii]